MRSVSAVFSAGSLHSTSHGVLHEDFSAVADTEKATISSSVSQIRRCWELKSSISIRFLSPASSSRSAFWTLELHLVCPPLQTFLINLAVVHGLVPEVFLKVLLLLASEARHSAVDVPRLLLLVLEALHFFLRVLPNAPDFASVRLASYSRVLGASGFYPCRWPSR